MSHKELAAKAMITKSEGDGDTGSGTFTAILSTPNLDRDGEVVKSGAFTPLPERISIDVDHTLSVLDTVASGRPYYDGDKLMIDGTFASTAKGQEVRQLVNDGHITDMSVFFRRVESEIAPDGKTLLTSKGELVNAGFVVIPANTEAKVLESKQHDPNEDPGDQASDDLASALTQKTTFDLEQIKEDLSHD